MTVPDNMYSSGAADIVRGRLLQFTEQFSAKSRVEQAPKKPHPSGMNDLTRQEMQASLAASEARVSALVESMRADAAELRAELREGAGAMKQGLAQIKASGDAAQAHADRFYAEARTLLADSRAALTEIKLAGEQNRTNVMALGYKILTWFFGAILATSGLYFTIKKAVTPDAVAPAATGISVPAIRETGPARPAAPQP